MIDSFFVVSLQYKNKTKKMKKLKEIIKVILGIKKAVEPEYKIYMPGETLPYDEIYDVEFEIVK